MQNEQDSTWEREAHTSYRLYVPARTLSPSQSKAIWGCESQFGVLFSAVARTKE